MTYAPYTKHNGSYPRLPESAPLQPSSGITLAQARDLIASWARASSPSGTIPLTRVPPTVARRSSVQDSVIGATINGLDITLVRRSGSDPVEVALPEASASVDGVMSHEQYTRLVGMEDGATDDQTGAEIVTLLEALVGPNQLDYDVLKDRPVLTNDLVGASISGNVITLTRRSGRDPITITLPDVPSGGGGTTPPLITDTHTLYLAYAGTDGNAVAPTAADATASGRSTTTDNASPITLVAPAATGGAQYRRFFIFVPSSKRMTALSITSSDGSHVLNPFGTFVLVGSTESPTEFTIGSGTFVCYAGGRATANFGATFVVTTSDA